jgi:hypothetical protein
MVALFLFESILRGMTRTEEHLWERDMPITGEWDRQRIFAEPGSPQGLNEKDIETELDALKVRLKNGEGPMGLSKDIQRLKSQILDHVDFYGTDMARPSIAQGYSWLEAIQADYGLETQ